MLSIGRSGHSYNTMRGYGSIHANNYSSENNNSSSSNGGNQHSSNGMSGDSAGKFILYRATLTQFVV